MPSFKVDKAREAELARRKAQKDAQAKLAKTLPPPYVQVS